MNRGLVNGLFHALGTSRVCRPARSATPAARTAWDVTRRPGRRRRSAKIVVHSDLVISWGADLAATNVHFWALAEEQRKKRGVPIVVHRSAPHPQRQGGRSLPADPYRHRCRAGARRDAHPGARQAGRPQLPRRAHAGLRPRRGGDPAEVHARATWPRSPGLRVADIEKLAAMYGKAKAALIRLGEGMTRLAHGGQALRTVALLPGVTGHYGVTGRRRAAADRGVVRSQLRRDAQAVRPGDLAHGQPSAAGRRAAQHEGSADPRALRLGQQSGGDLPRGAQGVGRASAARTCSPWCTIRS